MSSLKITEIFLSIQGESTLVGLPTVFVRLTGCPLRCTYCDTAYAFQGGQRRTLADIQEAVCAYGVRHVLITGGEPLAQPACLPLMSQLCDVGLCVSIETSGALCIAQIDPRVVKVMDIKTPSSQEVHRNRYTNLAHLTRQDQIKFVIGDREDYDWAVRCLHQHGLFNCTVLFSPSYAVLSPTQLAEWILADRLPVRLQIQLHKVLWGEKPGV